MNPRHSDEARRREADAILRRVRQETEPQVGAATARLFTRAGDHLRAADADQTDPLEVLGTRIGRIAALVVFAILAASLLALLAA